MRQIILAFMIAAFAGCAKINVTNLAKTDKTEGSGMKYKLPQTQLIFEITVKSTEYSKQSCYHELKKSFAGEIDPKIDKALNTPDSSFIKRKLESLSLTTKPVDDPSKFFQIEGNQKLLQDRVYGLTLAGDGYFSNGEFAITDRTFDVAVQTLSSLASFASPFILPRSELKVNGQTNSICEQSFEKLQKLREYKFDFAASRNLQTGVQLPSVDQYNRVLLELEKQETTLFSQLMFSTDITTSKVYVKFLPVKNGKYDNIPFFYYDTEKNKLHINKDLISLTDVVNNTAVEIEFADKSTFENQSSARFLTIKNTISPSATVKTNLAKSDEATSGGIFYNIPQTAYVMVSKKGLSPSLSEKIALPQWGYLGILNPKFSKSIVKINPETGELISVSSESKGLTSEQVKTAFGAAGSVRDLFVRDKNAEALDEIEDRIKYLEAKQKLDKLTAGEPEELTNLRKEKELLTEKKNLLELKKAIQKLEEGE